MATLAGANPYQVRGERFPLVMAILMALVLVAGFSVQLAMGRSSFASPWYLHLHALLFFGWTTLFVLQNALVASGSVALHRRLGWLAVGWIPAMVIAGLAVTVLLVRRGATPFFFTPAYFLLMDPLSLFGFAGLAGAAIVKRHETAWHSRLMLSGMALLTGPGFGRLLPLPFVIPYAGLLCLAFLILFPLAGVIRDLRRDGRVHPAWLWGLAVILGMEIVSEGVARTPVGAGLARIVTAGSPGAAVDPQAYPPPPWAAAIPTR